MSHHRPEAVIFVGIPGAGKSTFYRHRFSDTHVRINLDMLRTRHREAIILDACLRGKQSFVVDNTNASRTERERYIPAARAARFRVTGYFFRCDPNDAIERNRRREGRGRIAEGGIWNAWKRLEIPSVTEGFDELWEVLLLREGFTVVLLAGDHSIQMGVEPSGGSAGGGSAG